MRVPVTETDSTEESDCATSCPAVAAGAGAASCAAAACAIKQSAAAPAVARACFRTRPARKTVLELLARRLPIELPIIKRTATPAALPPWEIFVFGIGKTLCELLLTSQSIRTI